MWTWSDGPRLRPSRTEAPMPGAEALDLHRLDIPKEEIMKKQFVLVERALLDGQLREAFPAISDDHWGFWIYAQSCRRDTTALTFPGPYAAHVHSGFPLEKHIAVDARQREKSMCLYEPFLTSGMAVQGPDGMFDGSTHPTFVVHSAPRRLPSGQLALGVPFTKEQRKSENIPFVVLPVALFDGPWAKLSSPERWCLCAVYAFLTADSLAGDPNHIRIDHGTVVTSEAFDRASGAPRSTMMDLLQGLRSKGLISIIPAKLSEVALYPGSRSPLVVRDDGAIHAHLLSPMLAVDPKRARRKAA